MTSPVWQLPDLVPVCALGALLVTAIRHPSARTEAAVATAAAAATLASGVLPLDALQRELAHLAPVVAFLVLILVVADVCAAAGVFEHAAALVARRSHGRPIALFTGVFALAALVTTTLSLDATVVLLTPVVVAVAVGLGDSPAPGAYACLRMANSASLLLPVSNLTNLLAAGRSGLGFGEFAAAMAAPLAAVLLVEYVGLRLLFRRELGAASTGPGRGPAVRTHPDTVRVPLVVVGLMLATFGAGSLVGLEPWLPAAVAAVVLGCWGRRRGLTDLPRLVRAGHPAFALLVLALGVVVAALSQGPFGVWLAGHLPAGTSYPELLAISALATVLALALTNLSATLLLVPLLAPLGPTAVLAALIGLNVGSGLTWTGSLANLLWRRVLTRAGRTPGHASFHRVSMLLTPVSVVAAVTALWLTQ